MKTRDKTDVSYKKLECQEKKQCFKFSTQLLRWQLQNVAVLQFSGLTVPFVNYTYHCSVCMTCYTTKI